MSCFRGSWTPNMKFLVSVCNGAVKTLVRTLHPVLITLNQEEQAFALRGQFSDEKIKKIRMWVNQVSLTLAVMRNRCDEETGEWHLRPCEIVPWVHNVEDTWWWEIMVPMLFAKRWLRGDLEAVRYVNVKSMLISTICFALCMHVMAGIKVLDTSASQL